MTHPATAPPPSDADLIARARGGDGVAFAVLHDRHRAAAVGLARSLVSAPFDADDLVSEGFARVLDALRRGAGPTDAFRPYLLTTVRRLAYDRSAQRRREQPVEPTAFERPGPDTASAGAEEREDRALVGAAYRSLPERWQAVLWHIEVEGQRPAEVAPILGLQPNAVSALAHRAREGLRQAYLSAHARGAEDRACRDASDHLGALVRGGLSRRAESRVRHHVDDCDRCRAAHGDLVALDTTMRPVLAAVVLGAAATGWLGADGAVAGGAAGVAVGAGPVGPGGRLGARRLSRHHAVVGAGAVALSLLVSGSGVAPGRTAGEGDRPAAAAPLRTADDPAGPDGAASAGDARSPLPTAPPATPAPDAPDAAPTGPGPGPTIPPVPPAEVPAPPRAPVPSPPPPPAPAPPTSRPPTSGPATSAPPTTSPPTTAPPTTSPPTTGPPVVPEPAALVTDAGPVGDLIAQREGRVVVTVANDGPGEAPTVAVTVTADHAGVLDAGPGCSATAAAVTCRSGRVPAGGSASWFLPVVPADAGDLEMTVVAAAPGVPGGEPAATVWDLPVAPPGRGVTARFAAVMAGGLTSTGGTVLSCPSGAPGCAAAEAGQPGALVDDNDWPMAPVDVDDDPATVTSSRAAVALPAGAEVVFAGLYWAGSLGAGVGGAPPPSSTEPGSVLVTGPGATATRVTADAQDVVVDPTGSAYQSFADISGLVRGSGSVTVADVHASTGHGAFGGWGLVVVHTDPAAPTRTVLVFDGQARSGDGDAPELAIGGYRAGGTASVGLVAFDGDAGLPGDRLLVGDTPVGDATNPVDNVANSTISHGGAPVGGRLPVTTNTFGVDVDQIDAGAALVPGSTHTTVRLDTGPDVVHLSALTVVVDHVDQPRRSPPVRAGERDDVAAGSSPPRASSATTSGEISANGVTNGALARLLPGRPLTVWSPHRPAGRGRPTDDP